MAAFSQGNEKHSLLVTQIANHNNSEIATFKRPAKFSAFVVKNQLKAFDGDALHMSRKKKSDIVRTV